MSSLLLFAHSGVDPRNVQNDNIATLIVAAVTCFEAIDLGAFRDRSVPSN